MQLLDLLISAIAVYMVATPAIALLRHRTGPNVRRICGRTYAVLERMGLQQSWKMFTGSPLHQTREIWLRLNYPGGEVEDRRTGLERLPAPHQSYVQHWLTTGAAQREAIIDAVLDDLKLTQGDHLPQSLSIMVRGRIVRRRGPVGHIDDRVFALAHTELEQQ